MTAVSLSSGSRGGAAKAHAAAFAASMALAAAIVVYFHDRFWYPPDEGIYAYVASRILDGAVLNGGIQDLHAGYGNFLNAGALWLFGTDLVSLRYPLAVLTVAQSALAYGMLMPRGPLAAAAGAIVLAALSFVQFANPSANWYALFLAVATAGALARMREGARRDVAIGALIALAVCFRQLSGVLIAMGALTWLLVRAEGAASHPAGRPWVARGLIAVMGAGLAAYLAGKGSVTSFILFGTWPMIALVFAWRRTRLDDSRATAMILRLALGGVLAVLPLLAYHGLHGTLSSWFGDVVGTAIGLNAFAFFRQYDFAAYPLIAVAGLMRAPSAAGAVNLVYWMVLLALPVAVGWGFLRATRAGDDAAAWHPVLVMALFYAPTAAHYHTPAYLHGMIGLSALAALWLHRSAAGTRLVLSGALLAVAAVAVVFHAGQPIRPLAAALAGERTVLDAPAGIPRASIVMERRDAEMYRDLVSVIHAHAAPEETVLAVPVNPEIYFLAGRRAPVRFYSTALGLKDAEDLDAAVRSLTRHPPAVLIENPGDKYHTPLSRALMAALRPLYAPPRRIGPFEVYLRMSTTPAAR